MSHFALGELATYLIGGTLILVTLALMIWIYRDAESRGKSGILMLLLIGVVAWPWGVLIWLAARPKPRVLRVAPLKEDIDCSRCGLQIKSGSTACKNCGHQNEEIVE